MDASHVLQRIEESMQSTGTSKERLFQQLDKDGDGFLHLRDISPLIMAFQPKISAEQLNQVFRRFGLDRKACIDLEDFVSAWQGTSAEPVRTPFRWLPGPPGRHLSEEEATELIELVEANVKDLAAETNDLEFLVPGHAEAVWVRDLYMAYYEKHNARIERLMQKSQRKAKEAFYFSMLDDQCETLSSECYVWRIRSPGLLGAYQQGRGHAEGELLAWHGATAELHQGALKAGELRPLGRMLYGESWFLSAQPMQTFGKGPEWTVFYLCLLAANDSEMRRSTLTEGVGRVLPLYCLVHPSVWQSWPCGDWP